MSDKFEDMVFMGYKVKEMTRDGLLEIVKYQWRDKGDMSGKCEGSPDLDYGKIAQTESALPRKEVISIQRQRAMDSVNEAITAAKDTYEESIKKHNSVICCNIIRNIKDLTGILKSLEVYREQGKETVVPTGNPHLTM